MYITPVVMEHCDDSIDIASIMLQLYVISQSVMKLHLWLASEALHSYHEDSSYYHLCVTCITKRDRDSRASAMYSA